MTVKRRRSEKEDKQIKRERGMKGNIGKRDEKGKRDTFFLLYLNKHTLVLFLLSQVALSFKFKYVNRFAVIG